MHKLDENGELDKADYRKVENIGNICALWELDCRINVLCRSKNLCEGHVLLLRDVPLMNSCPVWDAHRHHYHEGKGEELFGHQNHDTESGNGEEKACP